MFDRHSLSARILFSAALLLAAIPVANAAETRTIKVRVDDLNLGTDAGRVVLRNRIDQAVETICGDVHMRTSWDVRAETIACSKAARIGAASQFDALVAAARGGQKVAADTGDMVPVR